MSAAWLIAAALGFMPTLVAFGQQPARSTPPTPLAELLAEANAENSRISAADRGWQAAKQVPRQVSTLPDPTFTYQQFSVGSPKPFAGYTNSDFSYVGIGASQDLPYPGKLRLRGEVAERAADVKGRELSATRVEVADAVKADYIRLAYLQSTLGTLRENERVLEHLVQSATAHYAVGQGSQADVLQAQVERTRLLGEITVRQEHLGKDEAQLKELLHRPQDSPDIVADSLVETPLRFTSAELLQEVRAHDPQVQVDAGTVAKERAALQSAQKDGKPDFNIAYMYQNTDRKYRDYYMFSLNVQLPRRARSRAEVAEAAEKLAQSRDLQDAHLEQQLSQAQQEYVAVSSAAELLKENREGLIPQSAAVYRSTLNAYAANRGQFAPVLRAFLNLLDLKLEDAQALAEHEAALAHLESLTGATLR